MGNRGPEKLAAVLNVGRGGKVWDRRGFRSRRLGWVGIMEGMYMDGQVETRSWFIFSGLLKPAK